MKKSMRKSIPYLLAGTLACFALGLSACDDGDKDDVRAEGIINGFETLEDLYETRFNMLDSTFTDNYKATVNTDKTYVHSGNGSVKFEYHSSATNPGFLFYGERIKGFDVLQLKEASLWLYNGCEHEIVTFFHLHKKGGTNKSDPMYTETFTLAPNAWTELTLPINNVVMQYNGDNVFGFGVEFKLNGGTHSGADERPCILYMDDFGIEYGAKMTEEDEQAKTLIDQVIEKISKLPSAITVDSEETILEVYNLYKNLPDKYKGAVTNYGLYTTAVNKFVSELNKGSTKEEATILFMDKFIGSSQFRESPTFDEMATLGYTTEEKYGDEVGSTYIQFYGDEETKVDGQAYAGWFWSTSAVLSDYDYVEFAVKNATDQQITFWWTWGGTTQLDPSDEWQVLRYPISVFATAVKEFECTSSNHVGPNGRFYFSAIKAYAGRVDGLTDPALTDGTYTVTGSATKTTTEEGTKITATADGNITLALNKTLETLTVGENAYLNVKVASDRKLKALNADGVTQYEISLLAGWNTVAFTVDGAYNLNGVTAFQIAGAKNGEEVTFGDFVLAKPSNEKVVQVYMQSKYLDETNPYALAQYLATFEQLDGTQVKLLETEYATAQSDATAWKASLHTAFVSLINATYAEFNATDARTVKIVYDVYQELADVTPLTAEENAKADSVIEQWSLLPITLIDAATEYGKFSNNFVAASDQSKWSPMSWGNRGATYATAMDDTHGAVITGATATVFQWGWINFNEGVRTSEESSITDLYKYWQTKLAGLDKVVFYVYNPEYNPHRIKLMSANAGISAFDAVTLKQGWNEIVVDADKFLGVFGSAPSGNPYIFINFYTSDGGNQVGGQYSVQFKFSSFYGYTQKGWAKIQAEIEAEKVQKAQGAIALIDELPNVSTLTYATPALNVKVAEILVAYETIGNAITNYAQFETFYATYKNLPTMLLSADADFAKFTGEGLPSYWPSACALHSTMSKQTDTTHGTVLQAVVTEHNQPAAGYLDFNKGVTDVAAHWTAQLAGLDKIVFYVWHDYSTALKMGMRDKGLNVLVPQTSCASGEWTMVTVDVTTFLAAVQSKTPYICFADNGNPSLKGVTFKFTSFVGYTNAQYDANFAANN